MFDSNLMNEILRFVGRWVFVKYFIILFFIILHSKLTLVFMKVQRSNAFLTRKVYLWPCIESLALLWRSSSPCTRLKAGILLMKYFWPRHSLSLYGTVIQKKSKFFSNSEFWNHSFWANFNPKYSEKILFWI